MNRYMRLHSRKARGSNVDQRSTKVSSHLASNQRHGIFISRQLSFTGGNFESEVHRVDSYPARRDLIRFPI